MTANNSPGLVGLSDAKRLEFLVTSVRDYAIFMLDPLGTIVSWNAGAQRFKGYSREEVIREHFSIFYTDADRQAGVPDRALQIAAAEGKFEAENWRGRKDGSRFWAHVVIDPILNEDDGRVIGYAKITRDVTERKIAQEALRRSEEQFRLLVQGVTDYAIFMLAPDGTISSWNAGAARIKGYERKEVVGKHFSCFYSAEDQVANMPTQTLAIAARDGRVEREGWRIRKDGSRF
jgi:PAS domain S-box-containing protein